MLFAVTTMFRHAWSDFTFISINESVQPFFRNHVNYSALLICVIPIVVAFINFASKKQRVFLVIMIMILAAATYFSFARGAWLAVFIGIITWWLLKKRLLDYGFILSILIILSAIAWLKKDDRYIKYAHDYNTTIFHANFKQHLAATYRLKDVSTAERFYRWIGGVKMIKDNWQTGTGPGTFYPVYKGYTIGAFKTWVSRNDDHSTVHNYFLLTLIEQGVVGLLLLLFLLGYLFYTAQNIYWRTKDRFWKNTVAIVAVILSMVCTVNFLSDLIETDKIGSVFYLCIAVLIIADNQTRKKLNGSL
jgi:O-antigen ligase